MKVSKLLLTAALCIICDMGYAQKTNPPRDSLKIAVNELAFHPDSVDLLLKKAAWNIELGEWNYAKDAYDKVLALHPANIAGLYYRAYVNEQLRRYNFARMDYENLLLLVPGNFEAQLGLALLNQKDKRYTLALDQINRLVSQYPDSALAYAARGGMENERGMYDLALDDYTMALKKSPGNTDYRLNRIDLYIRLGKIDAAKADLDWMVVHGVPRAALLEQYKRLKR